MKRDVTTVSFCQTTFRKKQLYNTTILIIDFEIARQKVEYSSIWLTDTFGIQVVNMCPIAEWSVN